MEKISALHFVIFSFLFAAVLTAEQSAKDGPGGLNQELFPVLAAPLNTPQPEYNVNWFVGLRGAVDRRSHIGYQDMVDRGMEVVDGNNFHEWGGSLGLNMGYYDFFGSIEAAYLRVKLDKLAIDAANQKYQLGLNGFLVGLYVKSGALINGHDRLGLMLGWEGGNIDQDATIVLKRRSSMAVCFGAFAGRDLGRKFSIDLETGLKLNAWADPQPGPGGVAFPDAFPARNSSVFANLAFNWYPFRGGK